MKQIELEHGGMLFKRVAKRGEYLAKGSLAAHQRMDHARTARDERIREEAYREFANRLEYASKSQAWEIREWIYGATAEFMSLKGLLPKGDE